MVRVKTVAQRALLAPWNETRLRGNIESQRGQEITLRLCNERFFIELMTSGRQREASIRPSRSVLSLQPAHNGKSHTQSHSSPTTALLSHHGTPLTQWRFSRTIGQHALLAPCRRESIAVSCKVSSLVHHGGVSGERTSLSTPLSFSMSFCSVCRCSSRREQLY